MFDGRKLEPPPVSGLGTSLMGYERVIGQKDGALKNAKAGLVTLAARFRIFSLRLKQATAEIIKAAGEPSFFGPFPSLAEMCSTTCYRSRETTV